MGGPARKSEGLGTKIWPDGRVWAENKWPELFWDGFGIDVWLAGWPGPKRAMLNQVEEIKDYGLMAQEVTEVVSYHTITKSTLKPYSHSQTHASHSSLTPLTALKLSLSLSNSQSEILIKVYNSNHFNTIIYTN